MSGLLARAIASEVLTGAMLCGALIAGVTGVVDLVERFRDLAESTDLPAAAITAIALARLPKLVETASPFIILLGAVWAFARLQRRSELVVARSAGAPVWRLAVPGAAVAAGLGVGVAALLNPAASYLQNRAESAVFSAKEGRTGLVSIEEEGLWLLDGSTGTRVMIRSETARAGGVMLDDVTFYILDEGGAFRRRLDADAAVLEDGLWLLTGVRETARDAARALPEATVPSSLDVADLQRGVASADALSIWTLPSFIARASSAGFDVDEHRYVLHKTLAAPVLFAAMALIAGAASARFARRGNVTLTLGAALAGGFVLYFLTTLAEALGRAGAAPAMLAAWAPALGALLFGAASVIHADEL